MSSESKQPVKDKFKELTLLVIETVYPKIHELLLRLELDEIVIKNTGWVDIQIKKDFTLSWANSSHETVTHDLTKKDICPVGKYITTKIDLEYTKKYFSYVQLLFDKIEDLESFENKTNEFVNKARKIKFHYQREVLTEKTTKEK